MATVDQSANQNPTFSADAVGESTIIRQMVELIDQMSRGDEASVSAAKDIAACVHFLSQAWPSSSEASTEPLTSFVTPDVRGKSIELPDTRFTGDRFEIRKMLGHGGFGVVLLAFDKRLAREVALKVPRPEILVSREMRDRFLREAQAAAALDHPNIVPIYDTGEIGPIWFITSRYIAGPTLSEWCRQSGSSISPAQAAELVALLAEAVHHAHSRGILHRDLKPPNILLEPNHTTREASFLYSPRLSDFGLARRLDEDQEFTQHGVLLGTPRYMAPEQAACRHDEVGVHTDIYALGVIFYELLTGTVPFAAENDLHTLNRIQQDPVPLAPMKRRRVPRDLQAICLKCLHKTPSHRYETAESLAKDLRRFLQKEPITARPPSHVDRIKCWCRRRPVHAAFLVVVSAAALIVSILVNKYTKQRTFTERNFALAQQAIDQDAITKLKAEIDVRAKSAADSPQDQERRYALGLAQLRLAKAIENEATQYKGTISSGPHHSSLTPSVAGADITQAFRDAIGTFVNLTTDAPGTAKFRRELATAQMEYGGSLYRRRSLNDARSAYEQASSHLQHLIANSPEESNYARVSLAKSEIAQSDVCGMLNKRSDALDHCYRALESWSELRGADPSNEQYLHEIGESRAALSQLLLDIGSADLAKEFYGRHVDHWTRLSSHSPQLIYEVGRTEGYFQDLLFKLGDFPGSLRQAERELSIWATLRASFAKDEEYSWQNDDAHGRLNTLLAAIGDRDIASRTYERIFATWSQVGARSSSPVVCQSELARSYSFYGILLRKFGDLQSARTYVDKAITINTNLVREYPEETTCQAGLARSVNNLGILARQNGDIAESERFYAQAVEIYYRLCAAFPDRGNYRSDLESTANRLAWMLATSDVDKFRDGKRAVQLANDACRSNGYKEPRYMDTLAAAYAEVGDFDSAIKWSTKTLEMLRWPVDDPRRKPFLHALELYKAKKPIRRKIDDAHY